ncbi:uncharacterized protein METZ01_LOCUS158729, partial [marine metagenome]
MGGGTSAHKGTTLAGAPKVVAEKALKMTGKQVTPGNGAPVYQTAAEVRAAYNAGSLSYNQACEKLMTQFGYSDNDCGDYLGRSGPGSGEQETPSYTTPPGYYVPPIGPPVLPGDF